MVLKPEGSGTVTLKSSSIYDKPDIDPKSCHLPWHVRVLTVD